MAGHAGENDRQPGRARDRGHDADRQVLAFEHRPLLDMQFDIAMQFAPAPGRRADMIGIEPELRQRLAHGEAGFVFGIQRGYIEGAGDGAAAEQGRGEPHAFLIGETDDFDRKRQATPASVQIRHAGNRGDHPERPIPLAGVAHGVVMRSQHQARQARTIALVTAANIADRIEMRAHSGLAHPGQQ